MRSEATGAAHPIRRRTVRRPHRIARGARIKNPRRPLRVSRSTPGPPDPAARRPGSDQTTPAPCACRSA
ncbi:hypothetical protein C7S16_3110 [Burkholderia thailandensis]|uniref:Uncharacterized protein n=1 Tax=Burkholderia thailandensis TaxID=57975 RepID=A0AAW9D5W5_BURTH|nr:hypothetical protein [Burkholderia thailandensis]